MTKLLKTTAILIGLVFVQPGFAGVSQSAELDEVREIQYEWARLYYMDEFKNKSTIIPKARKRWCGMRSCSARWPKRKAGSAR
jgi:hypothetical protein